MLVGKKVNLLAPLFVLLLTTSCKIGCDAEKIVSEKLAGVIASAGNCAGLSAIQADVQAALNVVKLCAAQDAKIAHCEKFTALKEGPIANVICPLAATALAAIVGNRIPVAWQCSVVGSPVQTLVQTACQTLPL